MPVPSAGVYSCALVALSRLVRMLPPRLLRRYALLPLMAGLALCVVLLVYLVAARAPDPELDPEIDLTAFQLVRHVNDPRYDRQIHALHDAARAFDEARERSPQAVVRIVHQSWKTAELPPRFRLLARTWRDCFPDWTHVLWTDADNERFVRDEYPAFYARYRSFTKHIYRVDAVRYLYLHRFGGVYTDLDGVCLRPHAHLLAGAGLVLGDMDTSEWHFERDMPWHYVQNSWMYSRPGHQFWLQLVARINASVGDTSGAPEPLTGPHALMRELAARTRAAEPSVADIRVLPPAATNPFSWTHPERERDTSCVSRNRMSEEALVRCIAAHRNRSDEFVLQLHTQTWGHGTVL